ncbi:GlxA family transcriptional regulator [Pseudophaeobacter sp. C1-32P7]|uniref:GlxA family transcriptional regulator n=1 Tax=Pseudophaeobacter sp. C1-32P7 TaxID=3098142 RepID=UPI0034D6AB14
MPTIDTIILCPEPCQRSSLAISGDMLEAANRVAHMNGKPPYFTVRQLTPSQALAPDASAQLVILPGMGLATEREVRETTQTVQFATLTDALVKLAAPGTIIAGSCSGCFALGQAGLLDGRVATTTWWLAPLLKTMYPRVRLNSRDIVVEDGPLVTAGAAFSHIDLLLHLIERFAGFAVAEDCRRFMMADSRPSQLPYLSVATLLSAAPDLQQAELFLRRNIRRQVSIAELAAACGMSPRTFSRHLQRVTAMTPTAFVQTLRVTEAIRLLRTRGLTADEIAARVGYADATALRRAMRKRTGRTLDSFREEQYP